MDIPEQFNREAPDYASLTEGEVWGPFVVVHPRLGEILGAQMSIVDGRISWFTPDDVGRIIPFSKDPEVMDDGSMEVEDRQTGDVYVIRPLNEDDFRNFNLDSPVPLEEIYTLANEQFAPFELEDDEEEE